MGGNKDIFIAIEENKNQEVLNELYKKALPKVKNYIMNNSGNEDDAKDLFQDAVISFFHAVKSSKFDKSKSIDGFIFTIAKNAWINKAKRDKKVTYKEVLPDDNSSTEQSQLEKLITKEQQEAFQSVFQKLGDNCKDLMKLSIYENLPPRKIMDVLGLSSVEVTRTSLYRCRKKLTELIIQNKHNLVITE